MQTEARGLKQQLRLGNKYLQEGNYQEAILAFEKAIEIDPKNVDVLLGLGKAYITEERLNDAERVLLEATKIDPSRPDSYIKLTSLYLMQGRLQDVIELLELGYEETNNDEIMKLLEESKYDLEELESKEELEEVDNKSIAGRVNNDKFLKVLSMTKEDVIKILGYPDIEDWWAGPYIYYEDASELVGNNINGLSSSNQLMVWLDDNDNATWVFLDSFFDIEIGMKFSEAMEILGEDLEIYHDEISGELGNYFMSHSIGEFKFYFYSYESIYGPIEGINVSKQR